MSYHRRVRLDSNDDAAVRGTLDAYAERYACKDGAALTELFADDPDVLLFGTGADERWVGRPAIRNQFARNFEEASQARFEWTSQHVAACGSDGAWVAAEAIVHVTVGNAVRSIPIRFTVVLERRAGQWVWLHRHASVAAGGQAAGTAYPAR